MQKWEVWGGFPFALHLKGLGTLPRSSNIPLEVLGWTTAAARQDLENYHSAPLSAGRHRAAQPSPPAPPGCGGMEGGR